jgi:hypothetical protein
MYLWCIIKLNKMTNKINLDKRNLCFFEDAVKEMAQRGITIDFTKEETNNEKTVTINFGQSWANPIFQLGFCSGAKWQRDKDKAEIDRLKKNNELLVQALKDMVKEFPVRDYSVKKDFSKLVALAYGDKVIHLVTNQ